MDLDRFSQPMWNEGQTEECAENEHQVYTFVAECESCQEEIFTNQLFVQYDGHTFCGDDCSNEYDKYRRDVKSEAI